MRARNFLTFLRLFQRLSFTCGCPCFGFYFIEKKRARVHFFSRHVSRRHSGRMDSDLCARCLLTCEFPGIFFLHFFLVGRRVSEFRASSVQFLVSNRIVYCISDRVFYSTQPMRLLLWRSLL